MPSNRTSDLLKTAIRLSSTTCIVAVCTMTGNALADTYTPTVLWDNGGVDGNYSSSGWDVGEPGSGDLAAINNGATVTIDQSGEVADRLRLASNDGDSGFVLMTGGDLTLGTELRVGDEGTGTWTQTGGDLVSNNVLWIGARGPGYSASGVGIFNLEGGSVTVNGTSSTAMRVGRAGATGTLNISGGTWNTAGNLNIAARPAAEGLPTKGTVRVSGNGALNVGTTLLNDASGSDPGEALLEISGSNATITALSYAHRPDATLSFIADAGGISTITIFDGPGGVSIQDGQLLIDLSAMTTTPSTIVLIDSQEPDPIAGEFLNAPEGTTFGDYSLTYFYDGGDGHANNLALVMAGLTGDFNGDTVIDADDIDQLTAAIRAGSTDLVFDLDGSTVVDSGDLDAMISSVLGTFPGDSNLDQSVDLVDLSALASSFGTNTGWAGGNFNADTQVDLVDLSLLATNFGSSAAVPEPGVATLLTLIGLGLLQRQR